MKHTLRELAQAIGAQVSPRFEAVEVSGVASLASAKNGDLAFLEDAKMLDAALASQAGAVIAPATVASDGHAKPLLLAKSPRLAFVRAAALLVETADAQLGVHPTAVVHPDAKLALGAAVGPHAVVQRGATIAARSQLGANVFVGTGVRIGSDCRIAANVTIYPHTRLGDRVVVHAGAVLGSDGFGFVRDPDSGKYEKFPQVGTLDIGDDVEIGANCTIDRGALDATVIGRGTKLDNMVHIGHNVRIGDNVVIAAQTGVSGSSVIGDNCIIGGQVGVADHVTIESGAILGAQCGVPSGKVIRGAGMVFWGTPARPLKQHLKELATLAQLAEKKTAEKGKK